MARMKRVALVEAAKGGDEDALAQLVRTHLPLVHTIVARAMPDDPDVEDVVQEVMIRAVGELPSLRSPDSFRLWLVSITARQVSTAQERRRRADARTTTLDVAMPRSAEAADPAETILVEEHLSDQRRQTARAAQWLSDDDRLVLSLWWLEVAGELSRSEVAGALGLSVAHTGVRVQRMRTHLDLSRAIVAAIDTAARCPLLSVVLEPWDGAPGPLWRKRIARHLRECRHCGGRAASLVPAEHLLGGYALLVLPAGLAATLPSLLSAASHAGPGAVAVTNVGLVSRLAHALQAVPVAPVAAGAVITAGAITAAVWTAPLDVDAPRQAPTVTRSAPAAAGSAPARTTASPPATPPPAVGSPVPSPTPPRATATATATLSTSAVATATATRAQADPRPTSASPRASATPLPTLGPGGWPTFPGAPPPWAWSLVPHGRVAFEAADWRGWWLGGPTPWVGMSAAGPGGAPAAQSVFVAGPGLADPACVTLRTPGGEYLFEADGLLTRGRAVDDAGFPASATLCPRPGLIPGTVALEARSLPGRFVRHQVNGTVWVDRPDGSFTWAGHSSFRVRPVQD